uniref:Uncharacterized protein n=1 Tax=Anopheles funestus TaxID=62324 RepID=A0A4Y0BDP7_ANOFN
MVTPKKLNVSGPKKRKTLQSVRRSSLAEDDDIIANLDECSYEQQPATFSRESSVNRSQTTCEQQDLIDSDDSSSDAYTDDMEPIIEEEKSASPEDASMQHSTDDYKRAHFNQMHTSGRTSLSPNDDWYQPVVLHRYFTSMEEDKSATPVGASIQHSSDSYRRTPSKEIPTVRRSSLPPKADWYQAESLKLSSETSSGNGFVSVMIIVACVFLAIAIVVRYAQSDISGNVTNVHTSFATCDAFFKLEERYKTVDENLWDMLVVNVRRATAVDENRQPGTILFLHYGPTVILDGFINSVSNITARCFGATEPITLDAKYFKQPDFHEDYGVILSQQKEALLQRGVMVVRNFQDVPAWAAQAFHTICDTEEPLVNRAVIYITLDMLRAADVSKPPSEQSATEEAEKLLHQLWKNSLGPAVLDPLITRLTENVYRIV